MLYEAKKSAKNTVLEHRLNDLFKEFADATSDFWGVPVGSVVYDAFANAERGFEKSARIKPPVEETGEL